MLGWTAHGDSIDMGGAPGPRRWLAKVSYYWCSGPHQTRQGFHLRHRGDVGNSIRSPWDGSGRRWWLATVRRFGWLQASTPACSVAPPVKVKAPKGAAVFGDPSGMDDSARAAGHQRDGELHMAARVLTIADQNSP
jgi:hypothetical protein